MKKFHLQALFFILAAFILGCNEFMVVGVISDIARSFHASLSLTGLLVTIFALTYAVMTPLLMVLTGKSDRRRVLLLLFIIFLTGNTMTAIAPNLVWMFISRILTAAVAGSIISLILVFMSMIAPASKRSIMVAAVFSGFSIATIIGVPIGTAISSASSWRVSFWLISLLTVVIMIALSCLTPHSQPQAKQHDNKQSSLLSDRQVVLGVIAMIAIIASEYTFYTYIRPIITNVLHFSTSNLNWLLGLIGVTFIVGNLCAGVISGRYGARKLPLISGACLVLLLLMRLSFTWPWVGIVLLCLLCFCLGMPGSIFQVKFLNIAENEYPASLNLASSLNPICTNIGVSLGSLTASVSISAIPVAWLGFVGAVYAAIALACTIWLNRADDW